MRIGITYNLKADVPAAPDQPDDLQEEFDSPATIEALASVLRGLGHTVEKLGDGRELLQRLLADPPDFVFNFAEGHGVSRSREARVPAVLEMLGIPYTGSDPLTMAVALDKSYAKRLLDLYEDAVPEEVLLQTEEDVGKFLQERAAIIGQFPDEVKSSVFRFPRILKPAWEGSSKGIRANCIVETPEELPALFASMRAAYQQPILLEEFIDGEELTVGIVGNDPPRIIGIMSVKPRQPTKRFVYSLEVKRDYVRQVRYECPAPLSQDDEEEVRAAALRVYRVLGCRDVARIDFRLRDGRPYFLEVNPLPGLNPESSDLVIMAKLAGWTYEQLIEAIFQAALERTRRHA